LVLFRLWVSRASKFGRGNYTFSQVRLLRKCPKAMAKCGMQVVQNRGLRCNARALKAQNGVAWSLLTVTFALTVALEGGLRLSSP